MKDNLVSNGKTLAIVSYLTPIGLIIAITMNLEKRNAFAFFHARQMLGLVILSAFSNICEHYLHSWFGTALWVVAFVFWLMGLFSAIQGKYTKTPIIGHYFQDWFKNFK